jgi:phosphoglycolate phosphatase
MTSSASTSTAPWSIRPTRSPRPPTARWQTTASRPGPTRDITLLIGAGTREPMLRLLAQAFLDEPPLVQSTDVDAVLARLDHHYAQTAGSSAVPYGGARAALVQLKEAGIKLACVSNKECRHLRRVLQATRLDLLRSSSAAIPGTKKPHASVLKRVARELASTPTAWRTWAIRAWTCRPRAMPASPPGCAYGYNAGRPIEDEMPHRVFQPVGGGCAHPGPTAGEPLNASMRAA